MATPFLFGLIIDWTGNWTLPSAGSIVLLAISAAATFRIEPWLP
jgi:cyanate permease